jgi:hypothetical protein
VTHFATTSVFLLLAISALVSSATAQTFTSHSKAIAATADVVYADVNRDTIPDLVSAAGYAIAVTIMNSDGTIRSTTLYAIAQTNDYRNVYDVAVGDFNRDGKLDVVVTQQNATDITTLGLYIGNGDGTFQSPRRFETFTYQPHGIASADFNGDGKLDVAIGDVESSGGGPETRNTVRILKGDGAGGFSTDIVELTGLGLLNGEQNPGISKIAAGDFNADGKPDIAFIENAGLNTSRGSVYLLTNQGGDNFQETLVAGTLPVTDVTAADVNQDGSPDLLLTSDLRANSSETSRRRVQYFRSNKNGTFIAFEVGNFGDAQFYGTPYGPSSGDVNDDGLKDIIVSMPINDYNAGTNYNAAIVVLQASNGTFPGANQKTFKTIAGPGADTVAEDIKRDGRPDIAVSGGNTLTVLINTTPVRGCPAPSQVRTLKICKPINSTITSPVQIMANTTDTNRVQAMRIYIDGISKFFGTDDFLSTRLSLPAGDHRMTVKAWDRFGAFSQTIYFTVSAGCVSPGIERTIKVCLPLNGATVPNPLAIEATINDSAIVNAVQVYVDGTIRFVDGNVRYVNTLIPGLSPGVHRITVKAWDAQGAFSTTVYVTVQ